METNPGLLAELLNSEFLGGFPDKSRDEVVRVMLGECNKNWEEHVKLTIRQVLVVLYSFSGSCGVWVVMVGRGEREMARSSTLRVHC